MEIVGYTSGIECIQLPTHLPSNTVYSFIYVIIYVRNITILFCAILFYVCQWVWYPEELLLDAATATEAAASVSTKSQQTITESHTHSAGTTSSSNTDSTDSSTSNYRFVHFYRDPLKKVLSGYRYHREGVESWTQNNHAHHRACQFIPSQAQQLQDQLPPGQSLAVLSSSSSSAATTHSTTDSVMSSSVNLRSSVTSSTDGSTSSVIGSTSDSTITSITSSSTTGTSISTSSNTPQGVRRMRKLSLSRRQVVDFCQSVHLCETCCRIEHEYVAATDRYDHDHASDREGGSGDAAAASVTAITSATATDSIHTTRSSSSHDISITQTPSVTEYAQRDDDRSDEYHFLCQHLGLTLGDTRSLSDVLTSLPEESGLLTEASVEYYETLRMARIVNHTWTDPHS